MIVLKVIEGDSNLNLVWGLCTEFLESLMGDKISLENIAEFSLTFH